nr:ribosomal protein S3 [Sarcophyte sanguinea]
MGQKINPFGFRLGITQSHYSLWFSKSKEYFKNLKEDIKIRDYLANYKKKNEEFYHIEIKKKIDFIHIIIYMELKKFSIKNIKLKIKKLQINIKKIISHKKLNISLLKIIKPYKYTNILLKFIFNQLKKKVSFRKIIKKTIKLFIKIDSNSEIKGIKIQISGRFNNNPIAYIEWIKKGRIPLQTLQSKINFCYYPIKTIYGILSVKIWIFYL